MIQWYSIDLISNVTQAELYANLILLPELDERLSLMFLPYRACLISLLFLLPSCFSCHSWIWNEKYVSIWSSQRLRHFTSNLPVRARAFKCEVVERFYVQSFIEVTHKEESLSYTLSGKEHREYEFHLTSDPSRWATVSARQCTTQATRVTLRPSASRATPLSAKLSTRPATKSSHRCHIFPTYPLILILQVLHYSARRGMPY